MEKLLTNVAEELGKTLNAVDDDSLNAAGHEIVKAKRVFFAGCGRSGLIMKTMAMRIMHIGLESHFVGEVTQPSIRKGDVLIIGSSSGETHTMVHIAEIAKENDAKVGVLSSKDVSTLRKMADFSVLIPSREIKSVQPDGNLFEQSLFCVCDAIAVKAKKELGVSEDTMDYNHTNLE